jgi:hypothetical protein
MDEEPQMTQLFVEVTHRLSGRPWVLVTGRLDDGVLRAGDRMSLDYRGRPPVEVVVRSIELHTRPGKTTIAVDAEPADDLGEGAVLTLIAD